MENISSILSEYKKTAARIQNKSILLDDVKEKLSELVSRRLNELGLRKAEAARIAGISRSYFGNIANGTAPTPSGEYNLSPEAVSGLSRALQVSESDILEAMNYLSETAPKKKIATAADFAEFLKTNGVVDYKLTDEDRRKLEETGFDELIDYLAAFFTVKIEKHKGEVIRFPASEQVSIKTN